jgi:hypothetical protein
VRRCARSRGRDWVQKERARPPGCDGIGGIHCQCWRAPAIKFTGLAALFCEEVEGNGEGDEGDI